MILECLGGLDPRNRKNSELLVQASPVEANVTLTSLALVSVGIYAERTAKPWPTNV